MLVVLDQPELGFPLGHWCLRGPVMREMTGGGVALWVAWRPVVRDGQPGSQQTPNGPPLFSGLAFLDI